MWETDKSGKFDITKTGNYEMLQTDNYDKVAYFIGNNSKSRYITYKLLSWDFEAKSCFRQYNVVD